ncbi:MAG TPA: hypothetical protein VGX37_03610 [Allosphingosinicella sp.]|jgi:hypothetical protein|nr:hypothetical protein [Allosphingosinicella sp.]
MERAVLPLSRRNILAGLTAAAVAGVIAATSFNQTAGRGARRLLATNPLTRHFLSLATAEHQEWQAQVGSEFAVDGGYKLRLAGVEPLASRGIRPPEVTRHSAFIAVFEVVGNAAMPGDLIYSAAHPQYGRLPLFLTASETPRRMLALFN